VLELRVAHFSVQLEKEARDSLSGSAHPSAAAATVNLIQSPGDGGGA